MVKSLTDKNYTWAASSDLKCLQKKNEKVDFLRKKIYKKKRALHRLLAPPKSLAICMRSKLFIPSFQKKEAK